MKVTREMVRKIPPGSSVEIECSYADMQTARVTVSQTGLLDETTYSTTYDRNNKKLKITHLNNEENER